MIAQIIVLITFSTCTVKTIPFQRLTLSYKNAVITRKGNDTTWSIHYDYIH
jgi:hypothetical protein